VKTLPIAFVLAVLGSPAHAQVSTPSVPVTLGPITVGPGIGPGTIGSGIGGLAGGGLSLGGLGTGIGATPGIGVTVTGGSGAGTGAAGPGLGGGLGFTLPAALRPDDRRRSGRKRVIYASLAELGTVPTTPLRIESRCGRSRVPPTRRSQPAAVPLSRPRRNTIRSSRPRLRAARRFACAMEPWRRYRPS
jgi:hypothetical protein